MKSLIFIIDKIKNKIEFLNKELFKEYNDYKFFLVIFNSERNDFILGKSFFQKYPIIFNLENKIGKIGSYPNILNLKDNDTSDNAIYFSFINFINTGVGVINFSVSVYLILKYFKKNTKKRTKLVNDNFEYSSQQIIEE